MFSNNHRNPTDHLLDQIRLLQDENEHLRLSLQQAEQGWKQSIDCAQELQNSLTQHNIDNNINNKKEKYVKNSMIQDHDIIDNEKVILLQSELKLYQRDLKNKQKKEEDTLHQLQLIFGNITLLTKKIQNSNIFLVNCNNYDKNWMTKHLDHVYMNKKLQYYDYNESPVYMMLENVKNSITKLLFLFDMINESNKKQEDESMSNIDIPTRSLNYDAASFIQQQDERVSKLTSQEEKFGINVANNKSSTSSSKPNFEQHRYQDHRQDGSISTSSSKPNFQQHQDLHHHNGSASTSSSKPNFQQHQYQDHHRQDGSISTSSSTPNFEQHQYQDHHRQDGSISTSSCKPNFQQHQYQDHHRQDGSISTSSSKPNFQQRQDHLHVGNVSTSSSKPNFHLQEHEDRAHSQWATSRSKPFPAMTVRQEPGVANMKHQERQNNKDDDQQQHVSIISTTINDFDDSSGHTDHSSHHQDDKNHRICHQQDVDSHHEEERSDVSKLTSVNQDLDSVKEHKDQLRVKLLQEGAIVFSNLDVDKSQKILKKTLYREMKRSKILSEVSQF